MLSEHLADHALAVLVAADVALVDRRPCRPVLGDEALDASDGRE